MKSICWFIFSIFNVSATAQKDSLKWFKGNVHTHSLWSDGNEFPEMIMDWYKSRGYDFVSLSDHNTLAEGEKWVQIPAHPFRQQGYKTYLQKFGHAWVQSKTDTGGRINVKLKTFEEYRPLFEEKDKFLIMQAEEISDQFDKKPIHIGAINVRELIKPQGGNSVAHVMQRNLDALLEQRKRTGQPMFAHINHPNFVWAIKLEDMMQLKGDRFFEVYNGHPHVHNYGDSTTIGMEELWDRLQIHYIRQGRDLIYGLATDDAHNFLEYSVGVSNPGRGWLMVRASNLSAFALIDAMEKGDFYSTTGVELDGLEFEGRNLKIDIKELPGVEYRIEFWGALKNHSGTEQKGILFKEIKGSKASFRVRNRHMYVRAKIISSKLKENPYAEGDMESAWTQPVQKGSYKR